MEFSDEFFADILRVNREGFYIWPQMWHWKFPAPNIIVITGTILSIWINGPIGQEKINIPRCSVVLASM